MMQMLERYNHYSNRAYSGTTYWYRLRATNAFPCGTTGNSNVISFTALIAPSIPTDDPGSGAGCNQITANWQAAANATTYLLDVATTPGFTAGTFVAGYNNVDVGNVTTLVIPGLSAGTTYYYRVRASNGCGTSGNSGTVTYATLGGLSAPVASAATAIGCTGFTAIGAQWQVLPIIILMFLRYCFWKFCWRLQ